MQNTPRPSYITGIVLVCGAAFLFAVLDSSSSFIAATIPILAALWCRYLLQTVMMMVMIRRESGQWWPRSNNLPWQIARAFSFVLTVGFGFLSLRYMQVGEYTAISMMAPVLASVLAMLVLGEPLPLVRWVLLAAALAGALLIVRPGSIGFRLYMLLPFGQVATAVLYFLITSHLSTYDKPLTSQLYSGFIGLLIISAILPFSWNSVGIAIHAPTMMWAAMFTGAFLGTIGHLLLTHAYRHAPSAVLMPYMYLQAASAVLLGWLFFGNIPDEISAIGITLIVASGVTGALISLRSSKIAKAEAAERPLDAAARETDIQPASGDLPTDTVWQAEETPVLRS